MKWHPVEAFQPYIRSKEKKHRKKLHQSPTGQISGQTLPVLSFTFPSSFISKIDGESKCFFKFRRKFKKEVGTSPVWFYLHPHWKEIGHPEGIEVWLLILYDVVMYVWCCWLQLIEGIWFVGGVQWMNPLSKSNWLVWSRHWYALCLMKFEASQSKSQANFRCLIFCSTLQHNIQCFASFMIWYINVVHHSLSLTAL